MMSPNISFLIKPFDNCTSLSYLYCLAFDYLRRLFKNDQAHLLKPWWRAVTWSATITYVWTHLQILIRNLPKCSFNDTLPGIQSKCCSALLKLRVVFRTLLGFNNKAGIVSVSVYINTLTKWTNRRLPSCTVTPQLSHWMISSASSLLSPRQTQQMRMC